ncbi:MAG: hypothetical protein J5604_01340 [Bacteroidales bacterium]|nr:hypothetical protein [Bacteroidales bacterium]
MKSFFKGIKYIILCLFVVVSLTFCSKDKPIISPKMPDTEIQFYFQINWFVPTPTADLANSYSDSLFINELMFWSKKHYIGNAFEAYSGIPKRDDKWDTFFGFTKWVDESIDNYKADFQFYKSDKIIYETQLTNLKKGRYNFVVYDLKKSPLVIDNKYPYFSTEEKKKSHCSIMFVNVLFSDMTTTYPGKCQYQYSINGEEVWHNLGTPVKFGETTDRVELELNDNSVLFSFRVLDEDGNELNRKDSEKITKKATIKPGESYMYFLGGTLTDNSDIYPWRSL